MDIVNMKQQKMNKLISEDKLREIVDLLLERRMLQVKRILLEVLNSENIEKIIDELNHYTDYGGKPNNYIKTKALKKRLPK